MTHKCPNCGCKNYTILDKNYGWNLSKGNVKCKKCGKQYHKKV